MYIILERSGDFINVVCDTEGESLLFEGYIEAVEYINDEMDKTFTQVVDIHI